MEPPTLASCCTVPAMLPVAARFTARIDAKKSNAPSPRLLNGKLRATSKSTTMAAPVSGTLIGASTNEPYDSSPDPFHCTTACDPFLKRMPAEESTLSVGSCADGTVALNTHEAPRGVTAAGAVTLVTRERTRWV